MLEVLSFAANHKRPFLQLRLPCAKEKAQSGYCIYKQSFTALRLINTSFFLMIKKFNRSKNQAADVDKSRRTCKGSFANFSVNSCVVVVLCSHYIAAVFIFAVLEIAMSEAVNYASRWFRLRRWICEIIFFWNTIMLTRISFGSQVCSVKYSGTIAIHVFSIQCLMWFFYFCGSEMFKIQLLNSM